MYYPNIQYFSRHDINNMYEGTLLHLSSHILFNYLWPLWWSIDMRVVHLQSRSRLKSEYSVDTGRKLNVHKTPRRHPGRLLNVLCTFHLRPVSTGYGHYCENLSDNFTNGRSLLIDWLTSFSVISRMTNQNFMLQHTNSR